MGDLQQRKAMLPKEGEAKLSKVKYDKAHRNRHCWGEIYKTRRGKSRGMCSQVRIKFIEDMGVPIY